jgi:hypothetical protein
MRSSIDFFRTFEFKKNIKLFEVPLKNSSEQLIQEKSSKNIRFTSEHMERDTNNLVGGGLVNPKSGLENVGHVLVDNNNEHYSCAMNKVDINKNTNSYYTLQIIKHNNLDECYIFRSWGEIGQNGKFNFKFFFEII